MRGCQASGDDIKGILAHNQMTALELLFHMILSVNICVCLSYRKLSFASEYLERVIWH